MTIEFNHMLKNVVDAVVNGRMYFEPYDGNIMSESVPTMRYQPLQKSDAFYQSFYSCVCEFRNSVNLNYRDDYFRSLWNDAFYCIAHVLSKQLADDMNATKMFYWYKSELNARTPGNNAYRALCDFIYGYKNTFVTMFNRVPFKPHYLPRQVAVEAQVHGYARNLRPPHSGPAPARRDRAGNARLQNYAFTFITYDTPQSLWLRFFCFKKQTETLCFGNAIIFGAQENTHD